MITEVLAEIILFVVFVAVVVVGTAVGYWMVLYNGLISVSKNIAKAWANIDVLLKQRHDELPKLVTLCKGYMAHENAVFDRVMRSREALFGAVGPVDKGHLEGELQSAVRQMFALAEGYPELKAQASFQQLQMRVSALESQIADRRELYNETVNIYNVRIASMPDVFVARRLELHPQEMYKIDTMDRNDVPLDFGSGS